MKLKGAISCAVKCSQTTVLDPLYPCTSKRLTRQDYPNACVRCFSTRHGAQAYVYGWDCKGRYSLPVGIRLGN
jgi:hypothetical protein